jgi:hypothetical protein
MNNRRIIDTLDEVRSHIRHASVICNDSQVRLYLNKALNKTELVNSVLKTREKHLVQCLEEDNS